VKCDTFAYFYQINSLLRCQTPTSFYFSFGANIINCPRRHAFRGIHWKRAKGKYRVVSVVGNGDLL